MTRRVLRRLLRAYFEWGYGRPANGWACAMANGAESVWTIEQWRHDADPRADRYAGMSLARLFVVEAAASLDLRRSHRPDA